jgi:hypothetical protein
MGNVCCGCQKQDGEFLFPCYILLHWIFIDLTDAMNQVRRVTIIACWETTDPIRNFFLWPSQKNTPTMSAGRRSSSSSYENGSRSSRERRQSEDADASQQALLDALQAALRPRGRPRERRMSSSSFSACYQSRPMIVATTGAGVAGGAWRIDRSPRSDGSTTRIRTAATHWTRSPDSLQSDDGRGRIPEPPHLESRKSVAVSDDMVFVMDI